MKRALAFALALAILALLMTYPLVTDMAHTVPGPPGDNFEYVYKLWWFKHALFDLQRSPFFIPDVFYPFGYEVALSETTLAHTIAALPVTASAGEIVAYNLLVVWSYVLSGIGAYLLARHLTGSSVAGMLAGLVFAFLPYRAAHVGAGHLPLLGTGWLPLMLLYEDRLIRGRRVRDGVLAGVFYGLLSLSSWYYAYMGGLIALLWGMIRGLPWRALLSDRGVQRGMLAAVVVAGLLMAPGLWPLLSLSLRGEISRASLSLAYVDQWSASLPDFILPSVMHPLWGEALVHLYPQNLHENLLGLGSIPILLAAYAVIQRSMPTARSLALLGAAALVLAFGTTLHWAGEPVRVLVSPAVEELFQRAMSSLTSRYALNPAPYSSLHQGGTIVVPLPTLLLYLFLPFFNAMRVWGRFGLVVGLVVAVLAGSGGAAIVARRTANARQRIAGGGLLAALVLAEFATVPYPFGLSVVGPQPVDEWLRRQPGDIAVLMLPPEKTWHGPALYAAREHGKKIAYGYGTYTPKAYAAWERRLHNFPDETSLVAIREAGISYVLVGLRSYGDREADMRQRLAETTGLRLVYTGQERPVLRGDRLVRAVSPSELVPPTAMVGAVRYAYLVDEVAVFEVVGEGR